ncbi:hypothetical protein MMC28_001946 [Mycoblastus sanguinarius]|nr:hypothetical protein [Mycoblastus sanguinarius]
MASNSPTKSLTFEVMTEYLNQRPSHASTPRVPSFEGALHRVHHEALPHDQEDYQEQEGSSTPRAGGRHPNIAASHVAQQEEEEEEDIAEVFFDMVSRQGGAGGSTRGIARQGARLLAHSPRRRGSLLGVTAATGPLARGYGAPTNGHSGAATNYGVFSIFDPST